MPKESLSQKNVWYLRREGKTVGPFTSARIRRLLLRGQVELADEVSDDRKLWKTVAGVAEVVPPEMRGADSKLATEAMSGKPLPVVPILVSVCLLAAIIGFAIWWGGNDPLTDTDCSAPPAAGVDWRNCRLPGLKAAGEDLRNATAQNASLNGATLSGADLSGANLDYADISRADLGFAVLKNASLRGVDLRGADLTQADLSGADMGFADLSGVTLEGAEIGNTRFGNSIWIDGRSCAPESVGGCDY